VLSACTEEPEPGLTPNPNQPPGQQPPPPPKDTDAPSLVSAKLAYDSLLLVFDEPVKPRWIEIPGKTDWFDTTKIEYSKQWKFRMHPKPCIGCAQTPSFEVRDRAGNHIRQTLTLHYYFKKIDFPGHIVQFMFNEEETLCYALSWNHPSKVWLTVISMETQSVIDSVLLDFITDIGYRLQMAYNPFNNLIYIYTNRLPYLYAFSLAEKKLVKTIELEDDHIHPRKYPLYLAFTRSGKGLLIVKPKDSDSRRLKVIDSSADDEITHLPSFDWTSLNGLLEDAKREKIFVSGEKVGPSNPLLVFTESGHFESVPVNNSGYLIDLTQRKDDPNTLLVRIGLRIFIKKLDTGSESVPAYANSGETLFDFSYAPAETNFAWVYFKDNAVALLNFNDAITVIEYQTGVEFQGLCTTKDNKWLLMYSYERFYFYKIEDIRKTSLHGP
jgi:hypothetical protein